MSRSAWPTIATLASLVESGPELDDIGTERDTGEVTPAATGEYQANQAATDLEDMAGAAEAVAIGTLAQAVQRGLRVEEVMAILLERSLAKHGSLEAATDHLCFVPGPDDKFDGARLEVINDYILGYNGFAGKQLVHRFTSDQDLAAAFVAVGAGVLAGMVRSLLARRTG